MSDYLLVERREGYHRLTLNRPEKMNALTAEMLESLLAALDRAASDPKCRAVLLTGAGRGFCAGQDLSALLTEAGSLQDPEPLIERLYNPLVRRLRSLPLPVVCAVHGLAEGAGGSLALECDVARAAES